MKIIHKVHSVLSIADTVISSNKTVINGYIFHVSIDPSFIVPLVAGVYWCLLLTGSLIVSLNALQT